MELNDKNILISKLEKKVETYPSQVTKLPQLQNLTSETNLSQYSDTPLLCQNLDTPIKPTRNSDSNKGHIEFIKGKLETHHKKCINNSSNKTDNLFENSDDNKTEITVGKSAAKHCSQEKLENQVIGAKKSHQGKYREYKTINQIGIQVTSSMEIQIQITLHLQTN